MLPSLRVSVASTSSLPQPNAQFKRKNSDPSFLSHMTLSPISRAFPSSPPATSTSTAVDGAHGLSPVRPRRPAAAASPPRRSFVRRVSDPLNVGVSKKSGASLVALVTCALLLCYLAFARSTSGSASPWDGNFRLYNSTNEKVGIDALMAFDRDPQPPKVRHRSPQVVPDSSSSPSSGPPVILTPSQELSALFLFLTASKANVLPLTTDPLAPLNPDHVLALSLPADPAARTAVLDDMERECWEEMPVVIAGRKGEIWMTQALALLKDERYFGSKPTGLGVLFVDKRPDSSVLTTILARLTSSPSLPTIVVGGHSIGSFEALKALHDSDKLASLLVHAGATTIGRDAEERQRRDRLRRQTRQRV